MAARRGKLLIDTLSPQTLTAEQAALGGALISDTAAQTLLERLEREDFFLEAHRQVYEAIACLRERGAPADVLTVPEALEQRGQLAGIGGLAYLNELVNSVPTAAHAGYYCDLVLRAANLRRLCQAGRDLTQLAQEAVDDEPAFQEARQLLEEASRRRCQSQGPELLSGPELMARDFPARPQVIPGLIPLGVSVLAGQPKARKSFLALQFSLAAASGGVALGRLPVAPVGVLSVFLEDPYPEVKERIRQFGGEDLPGTAIFAESWRRLDEGGELWLERTLARHPGVKLVVLDPFIRIRGGRNRRDTGTAYDHDYADLEPLSRLASLYPVAILLVHHTNKSKGDDPFDCISGSRGIQGAPDSLMVLEADGDSGTLHVRGRGGIRETRRALHWEDHSGWTDLGEADLVARNQEQEEVLALLRAGPLRWRVLLDRLMDATGIDESAAKMRISRMHSRGQLRKDGGLWWAAETGKTRQTPVTPVTCVTL